MLRLMIILLPFLATPGMSQTEITWKTLTDVRFSDRYSEEEESIVELRLKAGHPKFRMDQVVTIKGRLKLNQDDVYQCNYIFEAAEPYQPD